MVLRDLACSNSSVWYRCTSPLILASSWRMLGDSGLWPWLLLDSFGLLVEFSSRCLRRAVMPPDVYCVSMIMEGRLECKRNGDDTAWLKIHQSCIDYKATPY